jgi:MFS family permease
MFLHGASFSFRSGADQAYLYEALGERQAGYVGIFGRLLGGIYIVFSAAAWIGAALSDIDYAYPFGLTIGVALGALWLAARLYEPPRQRHAVSLGASIRTHARDAWDVLAAKPVVTAMLIFTGPFWAASTIGGLYLQASFADRGLSNGEIGLVIGAVGAVGALGTTTAARVGRRGTFRQQIVVLSALTGAGIAGIASGNIWVAIGAYLFATLTSGLIEPLLATWFNHQLPSEQRATLLSVESWLFSVTMIVCFPAAGWLAQQVGWGALYVLLGAVKLALAVIVLLARGWGRGR